MMWTILYNIYIIYDEWKNWIIYIDISLQPIHILLWINPSPCLRCPQEGGTQNHDGNNFLYFLFFDLIALR